MTYASSIDIPGAPVRPADPDCEEFIPVIKAFGSHHLLWLECLNKVERGEIKRLLGLMPPGSGKSIYTSVVFPSHYMGRYPGSTVIVVNYGSDLPRKWGRKGRAIAKQTQYRRIFDTGLSPESAAADEWALENGSEYMGAGILAGITGNRADVVVWDDLIKGRQEADSDVIRNKTWEAYFDDLLTRKKPHAREIGITTRWHEDDPAGRILPLNYNGESGWMKGQDGNDWFVVCLPAEAERSDDLLGRQPGERLWKEWFGPDHFAPFKVNARTWSALYQQRPSPETGDFFRADWFRPYLQLPDFNTLKIYGASDFAVTSEGGDYTVHLVLGVDPEDRMYLIDLWRAQTSSDLWVEVLADMIIAWDPFVWVTEHGQLEKGIGPFMTARLRERKAFVAFEQIASTRDKAIRAQSIRGRMAINSLYVPTTKPWYSAFRSELLSFPAGRHDDQVDALSLVGQILDRMIKGRYPERSRPGVKLIQEATIDELFEANEHQVTRLKRV